MKMKKTISLLLILLLALSIAACNGNAAQPTPTPTPSATPAEAATPSATPAVPVAEEVKGVTIPAFSILVNGIEITQEKMAAFPVYSVQATSVNSAGTESTTTYVGFSIKDVLEAAGLSENYIWLEATAGDGYTVTVTGGVIFDGATLLAMTKNGTPFSSSPWFAPCTNTTTGNYLQGAVSILVNTTESAPDIKPPDSGSAGGGNDTAGGLPEILDRTDKVQFEAFSFLVNGTEVTNETLAGLNIYKITATAVNSKGDSIESGYTGYKLADVLAACGLTGYKTVKAIANDGYETELSEELIDSDYTLVAIEKDKELGEDETVWLAPCTETSSKSYCKLVVEITAE